MGKLVECCNDGDHAIHVVHVVADRANINWCLDCEAPWLGGVPLAALETAVRSARMARLNPRTVKACSTELKIPD